MLTMLFGFTGLRKGEHGFSTVLGMARSLSQIEHFKITQSEKLILPHHRHKQMFLQLGLSMKLLTSGVTQHPALCVNHLPHSLCGTTTLKGYQRAPPS